MGTVELSATQFQDILENLAMEWAGPEYDLLSQNCIHFCKELLKRLGVMTPFPTWISQLAQIMHNLRKEGHGAAQLLAHFDRTVVQQLKMAGHCIGGAWSSNAVRC